MTRSLSRKSAPLGLWLTLVLVSIAGCTGAGPLQVRTDIAPVDRAMDSARRADAPRLAPGAWLAASNERAALDQALAAKRPQAVERAAQRTIAAARVAEARAEHARVLSDRDAARRADQRLHRNLQRTRGH